MAAKAKAQVKKVESENKAKEKVKELGKKLVEKMKKALGPWKATLAMPEIGHVSGVTLAPLIEIVEKTEEQLLLAQRTADGRAPFAAWMGDWSPKAGKEAEKPVLAVLNTLKKFAR